MSLNQFNFVGNLTRDPDLRHVGDNTVVKIGVAINERYKDRDGNWKDGDPVFIDVEFWGKAAERLEPTLSKGTQVFGSGKLKIDTWDDKESGQKRSKPVVTAHQLHVIQKPPRDDRDERDDRGRGRGRDDREEAPRGRARGVSDDLGGSPGF